MDCENPKGYRAIFQGKKTFNNPLAAVRQQLTLMLAYHFLANSNVNIAVCGSFNVTLQVRKGVKF